MLIHSLFILLHGQALPAVAQLSGPSLLLCGVMLPAFDRRMLCHRRSSLPSSEPFIEEVHDHRWCFGSMVVSGAYRYQDFAKVGDPYQLGDVRPQGAREGIAGMAMGSVLWCGV